MILFNTLDDVENFECASSITENWISCFNNKLGNLNGASSLDSVTKLTENCVATYFEMLPLTYRDTLEKYLPSSTMRELYNWHIATHSGEMSDIMHLISLVYRLQDEIDKERLDLD